MNPFTNLPRSLRVLFTLFRIATVSLTVFWIANLTVNTWFLKRSAEHPPLIVSMGEIGLKTSPDSIKLNAHSVKSGSIALTELRGTLQLDALSDDSALMSALRWTMIPSMAVFGIFSWFLFGALRKICANLERGDTFSENNGSLVRKIGITLIGFSLAGFAAELWGAHIMGRYLASHVSLAGSLLGIASAEAGEILNFHVNAGQFPNFSGIVAGCLVLLISEAFAQGLKLKAENDLTV
jgi:hypothetical protein